MSVSTTHSVASTVTPEVKSPRCELFLSRPVPSVSLTKLNWKVDATDADVTFRSSDGVLFNIHLLNLKANTEGFVPPENATFGDIADLTETSATLEMLFQFIYPARHPELEAVNFVLLEDLAEAAEKYQVYAAMNICKIRMKKTLPAHASEVMFYAMKHGYPDIMDMAAPLLIAKSLKESCSNIPIQYILPWIRYHDTWLQVLQRAMQFYYSNSTPTLQLRFTFGPDAAKQVQPANGPAGLTCKAAACSKGIDQIIVNVMANLGGNVGALRNLDSVFSSMTELMFGCLTCQTRFKDWKKSVELDIDRCIPKFSTFL
ncbi:hypothetical protein D9615_006299 [Tricholomella constricta]|uniref:BTB domain-containing protein n=1 Tax=Tricholomella constricta TaxID=117010 RepID=A0A8H5HAM2_9AGAR|nr:hypothetical protein D9615_006299 [Tricholomella constricta]